MFTHMYLHTHGERGGVGEEGREGGESELLFVGWVAGGELMPGGWVGG